MMPTWFIRNSQSRNDIIANATLAANNSGQAQRVMVLWDEEAPDHSHPGAFFINMEWWILDCTIEPDPNYPGVTGVPLHPDDDELPGVWSHSDFLGGDPDERSHVERLRQDGTDGSWAGD